jgi:hypothetical protein
MREHYASPPTLLHPKNARQDHIPAAHLVLQPHSRIYATSSHCVNDTSVASPKNPQLFKSREARVTTSQHKPTVATATAHLSLPALPPLSFPAKQPSAERTR